MKTISCRAVPSRSEIFSGMPVRCTLAGSCPVFSPDSRCAASKGVLAGFGMAAGRQAEHRPAGGLL